MSAQTTIAALMAGQATAIDGERAAELLAQALPSAEVARLEAMDAPERFTVQRNVAVVPVRGVLTFNSRILERWFGWTTYAGLIETAAVLRASEDVSAVVLDVDSPGGTVLGCKDAAEAIAALAAARPVHAVAAPMACSAAYWLASQATDISLSAGSVVGSIGIAAAARAPVPAGMSGYQDFEFRSSRARAKNPDPSSEAGRAEFVRMLDELEADFHAAVARGRGIPPEQLAARLSVTDDPADGGAVFMGDAAVARGLADRVESAEAFAARIGGLYAPPPPSRRTSRAAHAAAAAAAAIAIT